MKNTEYEGMQINNEIIDYKNNKLTSVINFLLFLLLEISIESRESKETRRARTCKDEGCNYVSDIMLLYNKDSNLY